MPLSLNEIGAGCFTGCNNLKTVYVTPKEFYASKFDTWHFNLTSSLKKHTFYNLLINNILYLCVT